LRNTIYGRGDVFYSPYAEPGALFGDIINPITRSPTKYLTTNNWQFGTISEAFIEQAFVNGESSSTDCATDFDTLADDARRVVMPCDDPKSPDCVIDPNTEIDARTLECDPPIGSELPLDDLAQALVGMHPQDVWVTRLEANLSREW